MVDMIVNTFFTILDIAVFTACGIALLHMIPQKVEPVKWQRFCGGAVYALISVLMPSVFRNDALTMLVLTMYYLLFGWYCYHRSKTGIIYQLMYMAGLYATQTMAIFLAIRIYLTMELEYQLYGYLVVLLKAALLLTMTMGMRLLLKKRYVKDEENTRIHGMVLVPILSTLLIFMYLVTGDFFFFRYGYEWLIVYCLFVLIINVYCLYYWYDVAKNQELKHKLELMTRQNELKHQYYEDLEENYNNSRKIIHDIRNHVLALEQAQHLEQAQDYVTGVHEMLNSLGLKFYTENRMLNIVLNDKLKDLRPEQVECNLGGVSLKFLADLDITTIFANLLDNAIEAKEGCNDFWIRIRGEKIQDFTVVKIANCYEKRTDRKKGHEGLGLENVRQALTKYQGELQILDENQIFTVTLVFPGQEEL